MVVRSVAELAIYFWSSVRMVLVPMPGREAEILALPRFEMAVSIRNEDQ